MDFSEKEPQFLDHFQVEMRLRYEEALSHYCLINRLNEAATQLEKLPDLCLALVNILIESTSAENCSIMLKDSAAGKLSMVVAKGKNDQGMFYGTEGTSTAVFTLGEGAAGWAAENAELLTINDCENDSRFLRRTTAKTINSVICAPILDGAKVLGVINCSHPKKQSFSEKDERAVATVAEHAGILLQKALFIEQLKNSQDNLQQQLEHTNQQAQEADKHVRDLHEQLLQSQKFATLGELLAGVAHELNNRIAPILIYSQMLQERATDEKDEKRLHIIEESAMGAKAILETLLNYSRSGSKEQGPVNLNKTLQNTLTLTEYKLRNSGIEVQLDLCPHLPPALVNERQIAQVFLNLINNALSAMEGKGGRLKIISGYDPRSITFTISDTGPGVSAEIADKIFEPFFTTKESGKGTGLGLSISKRYLEEHNGTITLEHPSNSGAAFVLQIPRTDLVPSDHQEAVSFYGSDSPEVDSLARILVVEDDSTIRDVIRDILGSRYDIEFATDGHEATDKIENDLFDLLVIDYHMPGLDGKQLYEWISSHRPSLKRRVVFSTGDIFHDDIRNFIKGTGCYSLTKPFSTTDLRETISGVLNA